MMSFFTKKTIVVPVDFSEDSFGAVAVAHQLADAPTRLYIVHVLPIMEPMEPGVIWHTIDDQSRSRHAEESLRAELRKRGYDGLRIQIRFGDPGHEIAKCAQELDAGLIVVPSHGRSAWQRLLIGSVTDRIVRLARCPVLVLKKPA